MNLARVQSLFSALRTVDERPQTDRDFPGLFEERGHNRKNAVPTQSPHYCRNVPFPDRPYKLSDTPLDGPTDRTVSTSDILPLLPL